MSSNDIGALILTSILGAALVILAVALLFGRGSFLIAGYNTMSKEEKDKYDSKALCKFVGKILLPIGVSMPLAAVGSIYQVGWIITAYPIAVAVLCIFAVVYCNTGNHFRK